MEQLAEARQNDELVFRSERELLAAVLLGGPVALAVKWFTPSEWSEVQHEFLASIRRYRRNDGSYRIPDEFVTVTGWRKN